MRQRHALPLKSPHAAVQRNPLWKFYRLQPNWCCHGGVIYRTRTLVRLSNIVSACVRASRSYLSSRTLTTFYVPLLCCVELSFASYQKVFNFLLLGFYLSLSVFFVFLSFSLFLSFSHNFPFHIATLAYTWVELRYLWWCFFSLLFVCFVLSIDVIVYVRSNFA